MGVQLTSQQKAAVENRGGELLVSAAAGSGKTRILVERLLDRVEQEQLDLDRFLVITYTKAAAAELRGKIMDGLNERLAEKPGNRFLQRQKLVIYRAQISTIHSFCTALLREDGFRLELEADFRVGDEQECGLLKRQVLERLLEQHYEDIESDPAFAVLVDTMSAGRDDSRLMDIVLDIHSRIQSHPNPEQWLKEQGLRFDLSDVKDVADTDWGQLLLEDARRQVDYWHRRMVEALDLLQEDAALEKAYAESLDATLDSMDDFLAASKRGWDNARSLLPIAFPRLGAARNADEQLKENIKNLRERCKTQMKKLTERFADSSDELLADMAVVCPVVQKLLQLVTDFDKAYVKEKRRRNLVDFSDLEHLALKLLVDEKGNPTPQAKRWQDQFAEIMVDEYQDTNEVQNAIFTAISENGKRLFLVGDVKQSIYRFRLADPTIFLRKYRSFSSGESADEGQPRKLVLSYNFRSRASVLEGVNFVFENIMSEAFGDLNYTDDQRLYPRLPYPELPSDQVELDVVDMASMQQVEGEVKVRRDTAEAEFVARRVRQLLDEQYPVTDGGVLRPVRPEDIAILYRSPSSVMGALSRALDRHRVPWTCDGSGEFFTATEVVVAMSFLEIVDNPRQDVPLLSVMTCPVYDFTGDDLAHLRAACPEGDIYHCVAEGEKRGDKKCVQFMTQLEQLRIAATDLSGHKLLWLIYESTGLMAIYGVQEGGEARQENLRLLHEYAVRYESAGHRGVFGLVTQLRQLRENGESLPAATKEAGSGVRIMSIHKSKGLEFPVVVVAGLNRGFNRTDQREPVLFHPKLGVGPSGLDVKKRIEFPTLARRAVELALDREMKAEEMRLLYVAMTRAREKLILVSASRDWTREAAKLAPDAGEKPDPEALNAQGSMAGWLLLPVLARPDAADLRAAGGVNCSLILPSDKWDIRWVPAEKPGHLRQEENTETVTARPLSAGEQRRLMWLNPYDMLANAPSKVTATQMKGRALDLEAAEDTLVQQKKIDFRRPGFDQMERGLTASQRGTAVHTVMQLISLDKCQDEKAVREELNRLVERENLTRQQAEAVPPGYVAGFFRSAWGRQALEATDLKREFKFSMLEAANHFHLELPEEERVLLQGVVDCCFTGKDGFTIVDFKTDRVKPGEETDHSQRYAGQLDVYGRALERIFNVKVQHRVLWYFATGTAVEI